MAESKRENFISRGSSASGGRGGRLWPPAAAFWGRCFGLGLFFAVPAGPGCQESDLTPVPDTGFVSPAPEAAPASSLPQEEPVPEKWVCLTFDDGPSKTTPAVLDALNAAGVKATFFVVGDWVDKYPDMVKEIFARGHEIGNHSDTHPHMSQLSESAIKDELRIMSDKVEKLTGVRPTLFRPPYGDYNNRVVEVSRAEGYECVQWSIDSLDWKDRGTEDIIKQCTYRVDNGDIVLFHNDSNDIVNALPTVIKHYQGLGYTILPVSELLLDGEYTIDVQGKQHPKET